ncbi:hypothetical protein AYP92_09035 [Lactobacillus crispatus]|uniref:glycosyltransferase family 4 protein n=1 Tax=Lactobacillus crispatus TaxID=47770 RepID=UPI000B658C10|nr:glycosyltransferase family 4 protein [Lactobacillus crispatus]OXC42095.1 hypothetical protein AYP92_09035 [Lactobacillus crispatus]
MKSKVAIITSGYLPVPPAKGGAVENLVQILANENELKDEIDLTIFSVFDSKAKSESKNFKNSNYIFFKIPKLIQFVDLIIYYIFKNLFRRKNSGSYRYIVQRLYFIDKVSKNIHNYDYDKLIIENHPTLLSVLRTRKNFIKYSGKYYYHAHNEINNEFGNGKFLINVKQFICVSQFIADSISKKLKITNKKKFTILKNKVDERKFRNITEKQKITFKEKYHIPNGYTLFTFSGRLNPEKGIKKLLLAYKQAKLERSKLIIAGSYFFGSNLKSDFENELATISKDMAQDIIFTGNIDYDEMPCLYAISDVIVLPSIWNDPAPLTVIESITSGKPLITTYSGGIPEYVTENDAIILPIDRSLVANLRVAMQQISNNPKLIFDLTENAKKASRTWTKASFYNDFVSIIFNSEKRD